MINIAMSNQAKSIIKSNQAGTPSTCFTVDNKFRISTEAAIQNKVLKMHAIKLWNLKSFANNFKSKQNRSKQWVKVQRFEKALQALKSIKKNQRACNISNFSI